MITNQRQFEEPLFVPINYLKNKISGFFNQEKPMDFPVDVNQPKIRELIQSGKTLQEPFNYRQLLGETPAEKTSRYLERGYQKPQAQALGQAESLFVNAPVMGIAQKVGKPIIQPIFKGFKDLTTKFLEYAKGKTALSKQEIMDFAKRPELKKGEADLLNNLSKDLPEGKLPAQEFADSIRRDLLELTPVKVKSPQFQATSIEGVRGRQFTRERRATQFKEESKNYEEVVFESPITTNGSSHFPNSKNYFAHARGDEVVESGKKIWREQEIQSDALQKEGLENFFGTETYKMINEGKSAQEIKKSMGNWNPNTTVQDIQTEIDKIKSLTPFTNDRFGERIMRERIKEKAQKGYEKYRLPTGETIGKIEGFQTDIWIDANTKELLKPNNIIIGQNVKIDNSIYNDSWIITDILGDGRFKAVPKSALKEFGAGGVEIKRTLKEAVESGLDETFDLTGKSNPQYRRYSDWGKFLKNKFGGKEVTDPQGNTWMEIDLKPEYKKAPVEAFGIGAGLLGAEQQQEDNKQRLQFLHR